VEVSVVVEDGHPVAEVAPAPGVAADTLRPALTTALDGYPIRWRCARRGTADRGTTDRGTTDRGTTDRGTTDRGTTDRGTADRGTADGADTPDALTAPHPGELR
jgi:hypothetical protein